MLNLYFLKIMPCFNHINYFAFERMLVLDIYIIIIIITKFKIIKKIYSFNVIIF